MLYADDLVLIAPTMEQLGRRVAEWSASLLDKGLKVNTRNTKVMVGSSSGKECRQPLVSAQYVKKNDSQAAKWSTWRLVAGR